MGKLRTRCPSPGMATGRELARVGHRHSYQPDFLYSRCKNRQQLMQKVIILVQCLSSWQYYASKSQHPDCQSNSREGISFTAGEGSHTMRSCEQVKN